MASDYRPQQSDNDCARILAGRNVLVLEQNGLVALDLADLLKDVGAADVHIAAQVMEASEIVRQARPDLALLALPERQESLVALVQQLAALNVPVIFVSSFEDPLPALHLSRSTQLRQPVSPEALQNALAQLMG